MNRVIKHKDDTQPNRYKQKLKISLKSFFPDPLIGIVSGYCLTKTIDTIDSIINVHAKGKLLLYETDKIILYGYVLLLIDLSKGTAILRRHPAITEKFTIYHKCAVLSPTNSQQIIIGSSDGMVRYWDLYTNEIVKTIQAHSNFITDLIILPDQRLVSSSYDCTLKIWNLKSDCCDMVLNSHGGFISKLSVFIQDADTYFVVGCGSMCVIEIWNPLTGECTGTFRKSKGIFHSMCVIDKYIGYTSSESNILQIFDPGENKLICCEEDVNQHKNLIRCVGTFEDKIITGSNDSTIKIWNISVNDNDDAEIECEITLNHDKNEHIMDFCYTERGGMISVTNMGKLYVWG